MEKRREHKAAARFLGFATAEIFDVLRAVQRCKSAGLVTYYFLE